jgi:glycine cleavage system H protein
VSNVPQDLRYTQDHEWVRVVDGTGTVGITDHAQDALSDVTFVDLPEVGAEVAQGEEACAIESCKAASDVYAPASGTVTKVNEALHDDPGQVNADPYGDGWIFAVELNHPEELDGLLSPGQYRELLAKEE